MNKISEPEPFRSFLIDKLPEPLTPASSHLQIIDRYIADTEVRLRRVRDPNSSALNFLLQKRLAIRSGNATLCRREDIHLSDVEYSIFDRFVGDEVRKNRYFHEFDRRMMVFDIYLGELSGLATTRVNFVNAKELEDYVPPPFAVFEITNDPFFDGHNIAGNTFSSVQAEVKRVGQISPSLAELADE